MGERTYMVFVAHGSGCLCPPGSNIGTTNFDIPTSTSTYIDFKFASVAFPPPSTISTSDSLKMIIV